MSRENPITHPGEVLYDDFLDALDISQYALEKAIGVPPSRINEIVKGTRAITADTALRLGRYFSVSGQYWLELQNHYDVERERSIIAKKLAAIQPYGQSMY